MNVEAYYKYAFALGIEKSVTPLFNHHSEDILALGW